MEIAAMNRVSRQDRPAPGHFETGDLGAIIAEYRDRGIGPRMLAEVTRTTRLLAPRYVATVYSEIGNWRHGLDDLVQDVITNALLRDGQAEYIVDQSLDINEFRRILAFQVKRVLARRRQRTVIDNLLARARPILNAAPFIVTARHLQPTYTLAGAKPDERAATFAELAQTACHTRQVPQVRERRQDRAPTVFSTSNLHRVLTITATTLPVAFTIGELDRILRLTLPNRLPGVLDPTDHGFPDTDDSGNERSSEWSDTLLIDVLTADEQLILRDKLAGRSDQHIATKLGWALRTATYRKARLFRTLETVLGPLPHRQRLACLDRLSISVHDTSNRVVS